MKEKSINSIRSSIDYTRTKDAYDGNMEYTNLKATKYQEDSLPESSRATKERPDEK